MFFLNDFAVLLNGSSAIGAARSKREPTGSGKTSSLRGAIFIIFLVCKYHRVLFVVEVVVGIKLCACWRKLNSSFTLSRSFGHEIFQKGKNGQAWSRLIMTHTMDSQETWKRFLTNCSRSSNFDIDKTLSGGGTVA